MKAAKGQALGKNYLNECWTMNAKVQANWDMTDLLLNSLLSWASTSIWKITLHRWITSLFLTLIFRNLKNWRRKKNKNIRALQRSKFLFKEMREYKIRSLNWFKSGRVKLAKTGQHKTILNKILRWGKQIITLRKTSLRFNGLPKKKKPLVRVTDRICSDDE